MIGGLEYRWSLPVLEGDRLRAVKELRIDARRFPVVFRYAGPGAADPRRLASEIPGIEFHDETTSLEQAVEHILERTAS